jgi:RNA polymerase sigma-70 factor (ECF subfamily)
MAQVEIGEANLVAALREGDEAAFAALVDRYHASMVRLAQMYVSSRAVAEEVAQEAWLGVLNGLDRFEGRSSLRTWIFRIVTNIAKTRGQREARSIPFSAVEDPTAEGEPAVEPERFRPSSDRWAGHWTSYPTRWETLPEGRLLSGEALERLRLAIEALPPAQREVMTLRDVEGWSSEEVCNTLSLTETNQRVLLHRARSKVRRALEEYFDQG